MSKMASKVFLVLLGALLLPLVIGGKDKALKKMLKQFSVMEKKMDELERENDQLKVELEAMKVVHGKADLLKRQVLNGGTAIGFSARISSHQTGLGQRETIIFDTVHSNYGNGYNNVTGEFKAPETGIYVFFSNIMSESGNGNEYIETEIMKNNDYQLAEMYSGGSTYFDSTSNMAVTSLVEGDVVYVRVHGQWSSNFAIHCCFSTFSGFLIGY